MTLEECRRGTALLGFAESLSDMDDTAEAAFFAALSRAVWMADAVRPRVGFLTLIHDPPPNLLTQSELAHAPGGAETVTAAGAAAYTFGVTGTGSCTVTNGETTRTHTWEGESGVRLFRGILAGSLTLTFSGEYAYRVTGLAVYPTVTSRSVQDIPPYDDRCRYSLTDLAPDAVSLWGAPEILTGNGWETAAAWRAEGRGVLSLPRAVPGTYRVPYRIAPPALSSATDPTAVIDLDEDLAALLPLLCAAYLLMEEDREAAAEYGRMFREQAAAIRSAEGGGGRADYHSVNDW